MLLLGLVAKKPQLAHKLATVVVRPFVGAALDRFVGPWPETIQETGEISLVAPQMSSFESKQPQQWLELRERIVKAADVAVDQKAMGLLLDFSSHSMDPVRAVNLAILVAGDFQEVSSMFMRRVRVKSHTPFCNPCTGCRRRGDHHATVTARANPLFPRRRTC